MATRAKKHSVTIEFDMSDEDQAQFFKLLEQAAFNLNVSLEKLARMSARRGFPDARNVAKARYDAIKNLEDMTREGEPPLVELEGAMPVPGRPAPARSTAAKTPPAAAVETPATPAPAEAKVATPAAAQPAAPAEAKSDGKTSNDRAMQGLSSAAQILESSRHSGNCLKCGVAFAAGSRIIYDAGEGRGSKSRIWGVECCDLGRELAEGLDLALSGE